MAKGFLSGVLAGTVVSVLGLGVVSLQLSPVDPGRFDPPPVDQDQAPVDDAAQATADAPAVSDTPPDAISAPDAPTDVDTAEVVPEVEVQVPDVPASPSEPAAPDNVAQVETDAPPATPVAEPADTQPETVQPEVAQPESAVTDDVTDGTDEGAAADLPQSIPDLANTPQIKSDPVAPIGDIAEGVTTNRLPTIDGPSEGGDAAASDPGPILAGLPTLAIDQNASPFTNPEGRPLMSIVLVDQGAARQALGDLKNLPFPISFVVDANAADAAQAVAYYRDAGAEVIVAPVLPAEATPTDAEVNFQVQAPLLDQAVAVFMGENSGFQSDSQLAAQISEILVASGHGLVSAPQGLNTGHKTALKTGVASGLVFRELDADGQDGKVIRRFLDNAAFKAGQENGVIMMGQARVETVQALIEWSLGNRVKSVAMAPISALLLGS